MNLFVKIFLGFWLSMIAIIGSWFLAAQYFDPAPTSGIFDPPRRAAADGQAPRIHSSDTPQRAGKRRHRLPRRFFQIFYGLQNVPEEKLQDWIKQQEKREHIDIRLVDRQGRDIFGRQLIPGSQVVLDKLAGWRRRAAHREGDRALFGQKLFRPERGELYIVLARRPPASMLLLFLKENLWIRLLLALLISGFISYAVSRYLTRPLKHLQQASRALADGDLGARIKVPARGGDETDDLARDFNSMATQLQEKIQAQKRLLSDVSHELRSPLARLRVALALAEKKPAGNAEQLQRIEREAERLDELISQLLSVPDAPLNFEDRIDLVALLENLCADANYEAAESDKAVRLRCRLSELIVRSHGDLLKKALENVIRNGVRHTPAGGAVEAALSVTDAWVEITIRDHGDGVAEAELALVFEPFYRTDLSRRRETGGFGLGLSIARRAVEQHGGAIDARNALPGLCITIKLPVALCDELPAACIGVPAAPATPSGDDRQAG